MRQFANKTMRQFANKSMDNWQIGKLTNRLIDYSFCTILGLDSISALGI